MGACQKKQIEKREILRIKHMSLTFCDSGYKTGEAKKKVIQDLNAQFLRGK